MYQIVELLGYNYYIIICTRKYEGIKNAKQTTYVRVKSILLHMQKTRSSYHVRTLSNGSSKWVNFKCLFWPKHCWGASGFQEGLEFWIILFSLQTLAALYCIMIIRSHIKDNIAVPWAIKKQQKCMSDGVRGHFWPPLKSWWIDKVNIFLHEVLRTGCLVATRKGETSSYVVAEKKATKNGTSNCGPLKMAHFRPSR